MSHWKLKKHRIFISFFTVVHRFWGTDCEVLIHSMYMIDSSNFKNVTPQVIEITLLQTILVITHVYFLCIQFLNRTLAFNFNGRKLFERPFRVLQVNVQPGMCIFWHSKMCFLHHNHGSCSSTRWMSIAKQIAFTQYSLYMAAVFLHCLSMVSSTFSFCKLASCIMH